MKSYDKLKDEMKIINLDGTVSYDTDLSNCISYVSSGKLVILKNYLQNVGVLNELTKLIYRNIKSLYGEQKKYAIEKDGIEKIHNHLDVNEISALYKKIRTLLKEKMSAVTVSMFRSLGLTDEFYVHDACLIRMMLPYNQQKKYKNKYELGKLTLHGPHHDFYQNVPLNAINTWAALGRVEKENSMFIYPDCWQKRIPQGNNGAARKDQYLGVPHEFSMSEGDMLIFHSNHMHASRLNSTDDTRVVLTNRITVSVPIYPFPSRPQTYYSSKDFDTLTDFTGIFNAPGFLGNPKRILNKWLTIYHRIKKKLIGVSLRSDMPPINDMSGISKEIKSEEIKFLKDGDIRAVDKKTCIARSDGELISFGRYCTHQGADLSLGYIDGNKVVCPYHGAKFDLINGKASCEGLNNIRVNKDSLKTL